MNRIWQRYFLKEFLKVFCLFISCFYFVYVLIDYSIHTKDFQNHQISLLHLLAYYGCQFTKRADILIPIAILLATIKVLTTANLRLEIVALATGGIPLKNLLRPFLGAAAVCAIFLYLNFQCLQPFCLNQIDFFESQFFKTQTKSMESKPVNALVLEDNSILLFQTYDAAQKILHDAYWLKSCDHILKIETLYPYEKVPYGTTVDTLKRSSEGELIKTTSYESSLFPHMRFNMESLFNAVHPPRMQSITQLFHSLGWKKIGLAKMTDREAEAASFLFFKLTVPLICLLAVIAPAPFCLRFSRTLSVYLIYALSIFGMIAYFTLMNSSVILGESQVLPPLLAIILPQTALLLVLGYKYAKL